MENSKNNYLRFISLSLKDYKVFGGLNDFQFNRHRTLIVGKGGTGKTIIAEALEYLGHPRNPRYNLPMKDHVTSSIAVITKGNCELIDRYRSLIFLNRDSAERLAAYDQEPIFKTLVPNSAWKSVMIETQKVFQKILSYKPWKIDLHRGLNVQVMAAGERICLGYAFIFAVREALKLDIPVVFDSPYAMLDMELRNGLRNFLKAQPCQQILLGHECEFSEVEIPKYILVYVEEHSHVMEF